MDALEKQGFIITETRKNLLSNVLVIVVAREGGPAINSPKDFATEKVGRIALAEPGIVPAGVYAKEYLEKQNLWASVKDKVIPTENVRGALAAVELGNVDAGMVYRTDAIVSKKAKVAYEVPGQEGPRIRYPVAAVNGSKNEERAKKFIEYLVSDGAKRVFERYGFIILK